MRLVCVRAYVRGLNDSSLTEMCKKAESPRPTHYCMFSFPGFTVSVRRAALLFLTQFLTCQRANSSTPAGTLTRSSSISNLTGPLGTSNLTKHLYAKLNLTFYDISFDLLRWMPQKINWWPSCFKADFTQNGKTLPSITYPHVIIIYSPSSHSKLVCF